MSASSPPTGLAAKEPTNAPVEQTSRWPLLRAFVVFQLKLVIDGLKDFVLAPLSAAAFLFDWIRGHSARQGAFRRVLQAGKRFDAWVDLYQAREQSQGVEPGLDTELAKLEQLVLGYVANTDVPQRAKAKLRAALAGMRKSTDEAPRDQQAQADARAQEPTCGEGPNSIGRTPD